MELIFSWIVIIIVLIFAGFCFWIGIVEDGAAISVALIAFGLAAVVGFMWTDGLYIRYREQKQVEKIYGIHITDFTGRHWSGAPEDTVFWKIPQGNKIKSCEGVLAHFPQGWRFVKDRSKCHFESSLIDSPSNDVYRKAAG